MKRLLLLACLVLPVAAAGEVQERANVRTPGPAFVDAWLAPSQLGFVHVSTEPDAFTLEIENASLVVTRQRFGVGQAWEHERSWLPPETRVRLVRDSVLRFQLGGDVVRMPVLVGPNPLRAPHSEDTWGPIRTQALEPDGLLLVVPAAPMTWSGALELDLVLGNLTLSAPGRPMQTWRAGQWESTSVYAYPTNATGTAAVVQTKVVQRVALKVERGVLAVDAPSVARVTVAWSPNHVPRVFPGQTVSQQVDSLGLPATFAVWNAPAPLHGAGVGRIAPAFGVASDPNGPRTLTGQTIEVHGSFDLEARSEAPYPSLDWSIRVHSGHVRVAEPVAPDPADVHAAWLVPVMALALLVPRVRRVLAALGGAFWGRALSDSDEHPVRARIRRTVQAQPGINLRTLWKMTDVSWTTFRFHVHRLVRGRALSSVRVGGQRFLFAPGATDARDWASIGLLKRRPVRRVAQTMADREGATIADVAHALGLAQSTVCAHLRRLASAGLLLSLREGRFVRYRALPRLRDLLARPFLAQGSDSAGRSSPPRAAAACG